MSPRLLLVGATLLGVSCGASDARLDCKASSECTLDGSMGVCLTPLDSAPEGLAYCAYPDPDCSSTLRWGPRDPYRADECVEGRAPLDAGMDAAP